MPSFPDQFRDLAGFSGAGLQYSSPSDTAVKMYDALVHQAVFHYSNHQLGGWDGTVRRMKQGQAGQAGRCWQFYIISPPS